MASMTFSVAYELLAAIGTAVEAHHQQRDVGWGDAADTAGSWFRSCFFWQSRLFLGVREPVHHRKARAL